MKTNLKVLTLNCWGVPVPVACKDHHERMVAIGEKISKSSYDIVFFQEVWKKGDYEILKKQIGSTMPNSHYFYSGSIGSGLCLFSKYPILETIYHRFDPNGYVHKIQHGDWFGGKGLGLAKISVDGFTVNSYITHIHAEYNRDNDEYRAHRIAQSFTTSQFIKLTNGSADLSLLCGDLNLEPVDLGYKMICNNAGMKDSWLEKKSSITEDKGGNTCDCPSNSYVDDKHKDRYPDGKRIDYILYKSGNNCDAVIEECNVTLGRIPGKLFNYSDHEAVEATISLESTKTGPTTTPQNDSLVAMLQECLTILDDGLQMTIRNRRFFILFSIICLILAYFIAIIHIPFPLDYFVTFIRLVLGLMMGFGIVQSTIMITSEVHGLKASRDDVKNLLRSLQK
ncbi:Sphingomyelin phosphodiesterase 2 [Mactra antiquata]